MCVCVCVCVCVFQESRCAYVLMVMAVLWLTEALPIPVTALLPVFMFPMAGILTAKEAGLSYFSVRRGDRGTLTV